MAHNHRCHHENIVEITFDNFREAMRDIDSKLNRKNNGLSESNQEEMNKEKIIKTEDGAIVRKVFVTNIDKRVLKKELIVIFESFGRVHDAFIKKGDAAAGTRINVTFGFVTFYDPQGAYNAIRTMKPIILRHRRLKVRPADTWHQPVELPSGELKYDLGVNAIESTLPASKESNCTGTIKKTNLEAHPIPHSSKTEQLVNITETSNINILNDDCLIQLFSYFTLFELIELEEVCVRWRDVTEVMWQRVHELSTEELSAQSKLLLTTDALRRVLVRCGKHLTILKISSEHHCFNSRVHQVIAKSCPSLHTLHLSGVSSNATGVLALSKGCKELRTLVFQDISGVQDPVLETLFKQNPYLECIRIDGSSAMTGRCLRILPATLSELALVNCNSLQLKELRVAFRNMLNLQSLTFESCITMTSNFLVDVADSFPNLTTFSLNTYFPLMHPTSLKPIVKMSNLINLSFCMNVLVSNGLLEELSQKCLKIESLDLSGCYTNDSRFTAQGLDYISKLPKLNKLYLNYLEIVTDDSLTPIANNGNLVHLELRGCPNLSDTGTIKIFERCKKLECLDVSGCDNVTVATLSFVHDLIKQQKSVVKKLKMIIGGSGIFDDDYMENPEQLKERFAHPQLEIKLDNLCEPHLRPDFFDDYFPPSDDDVDLLDMHYDEDDFDEDDFYFLDRQDDFHYFAGALFGGIIGDFLSDDEYFFE